MHLIGLTPRTHFLPRYVRAEPGRTGHDLERGTFYLGIEKEQDQWLMDTW